MHSSFTHARRVAGFSWPLYAGSAVAIVIAAIVTLLPVTTLGLRLAAAAAIVVIAWFVSASFLAFHWMFDRSELLDGTWLRSEVGSSPRRWVQISTGLEETTLPLQNVFPDAEGRMIDLYDPATMTEPALTRARKERLAGASGIAAIEDGWGDVVLVMLAAHEIRDASARERFFAEVARIASSDGRVVLVEHLRDVIAAAAFGPGVFHFFPHREWLRLGKLARLELVRERPITPFIRVFIFAATNA